MFIVLLLGLLIGLLDAFGLTMFLPLLELADGNAQANGENMGGLDFIVEFLNNSGIDLTLFVALLILSIFFVFKGVATYFSEGYKVKSVQYFMSTLRLKLTDLFTRYSFKSFVSADMGRIQNSFTTEVWRVAGAYSAYSKGIQEIIMTLVYMFFVFLIDWKFALLVCVGGGLTNFIYSSIYKKTAKESTQLTQHNSNYHKGMIQFVNNFKYLKATGLLNKYSDKLKKDIEVIEGANRKIGFLNALVMGIREPILIVIVCIVISIQVYVLEGNLATILMSLLLFYRALTQLLNFQTSYNTFLSNSGSLSNVTKFEEELLEAEEKVDGVEFKVFQNEIQLRNVFFGYTKGDDILKDISLSFKRQKTYAFVGESGSGKTTLVNLISGLLPISAGSLKVDGVDIAQINKASFQKRIGYIAQEPVVFNDTIFNNVTFWDEPTDENLTRFNHAIRQASIYEFVNSLTEKENTLLGNNGVNLSGGQKQRISIARELYKEIDILILDEATSALDSETEKEIQYNIEKLRGEYTILIIAHRLSTIRNVDEVFLMNKGRLEGQGSFDKLIHTSERFKRMVELQEI